MQMIGLWKGGVGGEGGHLEAHDSTLQAVSRAAKENLLLLDFFLGRHPVLLLCVVTSGSEDECAA